MNSPSERSDKISGRICESHGPQPVSRAVHDRGPCSTVSVAARWAAHVRTPDWETACGYSGRRGQGFACARGGRAHPRPSRERTPVPQTSARGGWPPSPRYPCAPVPRLRGSSVFRSDPPRVGHGRWALCARWELNIDLEPRIDILRADSYARALRCVAWPIEKKDILLCAWPDLVR